MRGELVKTECRNCGRASLVVEGGMCPYCDAGPAVPSRQRKTWLSGVPVLEPASDAFWPDYINRTTPVRQVIAGAVAIDKGVRHARGLSIDLIESAIREIAAAG